MNHNKRVVLIGVKTLLCDKFPLGGGVPAKGIVGEVEVKEG